MNEIHLSNFSLENSMFSFSEDVVDYHPNGINIHFMSRMCLQFFFTEDLGPQFLKLSKLICYF